MDDILFVTIVIVVVLSLAVVGGVAIVMDYRNFDAIIKQCETQHYIQNETVRISCEVEK